MTTENQYQPILDAAQKVTDSGWDLADEIFKEVGKIKSIEISTLYNELANIWNFSPGKILELLDNSDNRGWIINMVETISDIQWKKINDITKTLKDNGFQYNAFTVAAMAKMAAETPVSQRAGKNFWYAVKNQEENHLANWGARREVLNYFYAKAIKREKDIKAEELENKQRKELQKPFKSPVVAPQNILHLAQSAEGLARSAIQCCQQLGEEKVSESHRKVLRKASIQCANAWMRVSETLNKQVKEFSK